MGALTHNGDVITGLPSTASQINYDNTSSGMAATQVQAAVDELKSGLTNLVKTYTAENVTFSANGNALTTLPIANKVLCALIDADATSSIVGTVYKAVGNDGYVYGLHAFRANTTEDIFAGTANVTVYYI